MDKAKILRELVDVINRNSMENECHTPDYILAEYLFGQYEHIVGQLRVQLVGTDG